MKQTTEINIMPDKGGFYGKFGGQFVAENLKPEFNKIAEAFLKFSTDKSFNDELNNLLQNYAGRPSPISYAKNLSAKYGADIYLKREDLNHTGSHKINHSLGECLLAKKIGKTKVIGETGAGQHGVAVATAAALLGLECDIYMGTIDIIKERPNVDRMKILGANIVEVDKGSKTLKEAADASYEAYTREFEHAFYAIGSAVGPYPFPMIIEHFQSVIGREARSQMLKLTGELPDHVVACVGGGSNSIGIFNGFLEDEQVNLYGVEPLGRGSGIGENAASINYGKEGILHGSQCLLLQDETGKTVDAYSIASGLDYPGVGPKHCYLHSIGRVKYDVIDDNEAIAAFHTLPKYEGIIPALESSHAIAYGLKLAQRHKGDKILINVSGRGDKDIDFILAKHNK